MIAEILCVGTELLLGNIVNTNAAYLSRELAAIGIFTYHQTVVGDNAARLKESLALSLSRSDIVIITGGLGPTFDDLTKETVAGYFGLKTEMHEQTFERLKKIFVQFGREMTPNNLKQAMMPEGCVVFQNNYGTAPGLAVEIPESADSEKTVIMLPGPPREMEPMFREEVRPFLLSKQSDMVLVSKTVRTFGIGESDLEHRLHSFMQESENPTVAPYAKLGEVELRVTASGRSKEECEKLLRPAIDMIMSRAGEFVYGIDTDSLQSAVVSKLSGSDLRLATAESCTGGLIGKRITEIPGSSKVYLGGVIAYDNSVKVQQLGVSEDTLKQYGAVSEQTALEMCKGAAECFGADIGVSVTGIAGPEGGTETKPVGLVYAGVFFDNKETGKVIHRAVKLSLAWSMYKDEREVIRQTASSHALFEVLKLLSQHISPI